VLPAEAHRAARIALLLGSLALVAASAANAAGCGDDDEENASAPSDTATELQLALDRDGPGGAEAETATLSCEAGDGTACGRLAATDFAPVDPQTACTEIYGGPDEVELAGSIGGEPVETTLTRANGCEIDRFDPLVPVLKEEFSGYEPGAALAP
jgi:hypothetical protein